MTLDARIEQARRAYLGIEADPRLAERITARVTTRRGPPAWAWIPAGAVAAALVVIVFALQMQPDPGGASQTRLALAVPAMPGNLRMPDTARLELPNLTRTPVLPVIPPTPVRDKPKRPPDTPGTDLTKA